MNTDKIEAIILGYVTMGFMSEYTAKLLIADIKSEVAE